MSEMRTRTRILIADDQPLFRAGLRPLLERCDNFTIVGEASNGLETIELARQTMPDILLLDVAMPVLSGLEVLRRISDLETKIRSILLTAHISKAEIVEALQLGARGVQWKSSAASLLVKSIECVMDGQIWISREVVNDVVNALRASSMIHAAETANAVLSTAFGTRKFGLTDREVQIVCAVAEGQSNRDIALGHGISEHTVKHHLTHIFDKVGVYTRVELAVFAIHHRLIGLAGDPVGQS